MLLGWLLFFLICMGLGYPSLGRFNPVAAPGLTDTNSYAQMVRGEPVQRNRAEVFGSRILVPYAARLVYRLSGSHLGGWNPVFFSLLVVNAAFCATTALLIVLVGFHLTSDAAVSYLAATLYLLSFAIPNLQLAGLIDSSEAFCLMAVVWSLLKGHWRLLPFWGILGALAKEAFMPFSAVLVFVWWLVGERKGPRRFCLLGWASGMFFVSNLTMIVMRLLLYHRLIWPWQIGAAMNSGTNLVVALAHCFSEPAFWYVFGWLIPLGIWRLKFFPKPWVIAAAAATAVALCFGAFSNAGGTIARSVFDIVGPLLSLSAALLLAKPLGAIRDAGSSAVR